MKKLSIALKIALCTVVSVQIVGMNPDEQFMAENERRMQKLTQQYKKKWTSWPTNHQKN
jgi:hypothetical protein